jgi:hypothetical protein
MSGENDLATLLSSMAPELLPESYVFVSFADGVYGQHANLEPIAAIREAEGLTLIIPRALADGRQLAYAAVFRQITLNVHSSLESVGLTAAVATKLAAYGISANVVAGYFHDHLFVPDDRAAEALRALDAITQ